MTGTTAILALLKSHLWPELWKFGFVLLEVDRPSWFTYYCTFRQSREPDGAYFWVEIAEDPRGATPWLTLRLHVGEGGSEMENGEVLYSSVAVQALTGGPRDGSFPLTGQDLEGETLRAFAEGLQLSEAFLLGDRELFRRRRSELNRADLPNPLDKWERMRSRSRRTSGST